MNHSTDLDETWQIYSMSRGTHAAKQHNAAQAAQCRAAAPQSGAQRRACFKTIIYRASAKTTEPISLKMLCEGSDWCGVAFRPLNLSYLRNSQSSSQVFKIDLRSAISDGNSDRHN